MRIFRRALQLARNPRKLLEPQYRYRLAALGLPLTANERLLRSLKNRHQGKRIFIVGNGPSLNHTNVDLLVDEISIASNAIFLLFGRKKFRPTYYTIEDQLVSQDRAPEANQLTCSFKVFPEDVSHWLHPTGQTAYIRFNRNYPDFPRFSTDFVREVFWGGTVTCMNLQLAYYLGAREVILIGIDHNYAPPASADQVTGAVILSQSKDVNHFDQSYFGPGYRWHDPKVERMEEGYQAAQKAFAADGRKILNATKGGKLEVFPRVDFDSLF